MLNNIPAENTTTGEQLVIVHVSGDKVLCVTEDGVLDWVDIWNVNVPWRWDRRRLAWVFAQLEVEDDSSEDEDGGGSSIQGYVSDDQGAGDGYQSNDTDHDSWDVDTNRGAKDEGAEEG